MKITIIGNSVAMRVRPPLNYPENINYTRHLEKILRERIEKDTHVQNLSLGGLTIKEVFPQMDEYIRTFPDFYILNLGVVDSCTRDIPYWLFKIIYGNKQDLFHRVIGKLYYSAILKKIRPFLVILRGKRSWISEKKYKRMFCTLIEILIKETNAKIIVLPINLADERVEKQLPGSRSNHIKFNNIMNEACQNERIQYVNFSEFNSNEYYPDGIHFSGRGHKKIAEKTFEIIKREKQINN